jgi:signal transduction histidine kinase
MLDLAQRTTADLSPPVLNDANLAIGLRWLAEHTLAMHGLCVVFDAPREVHVPDKNIRLMLFHAAREVLFNIVKHAGVDVAHVELTSCNENLILKVEDSGIGFDVKKALVRERQAGGYGLRSTLERLEAAGGAIEIASSSGAGTRVTIRMPL